MFNDLKKLSSILDEDIEKGLKLEEKNKKGVEKFESEIAKSLSHNPFLPHDMGPDSPYYNPYRYQPGEGFMPYEASHWAAQGKDPDNYLTTTKMYRDFDMLTTKFKKSREALKSLAKAVSTDLSKAGVSIEPAPRKPSQRRVPVGTIHTYADGQRYKKVSEGKWVPMAGIEDRSHARWLEHFDPDTRKRANDAIEQHALGKSDRISKGLTGQAAPAPAAPGSQPHVGSGTGRGLPIGTVHTYADGEKYKKVDQGHWVPVGDHNGRHTQYLRHEDPAVRKRANEAIEHHADLHHDLGKMKRIEEEIDRRHKQTETTNHAVHTAMNEVADAHPDKDMKEKLKAASEKFSPEKTAEQHPLHGKEKLQEEGIFYPKDSLGVTRDEMPQISKRHMPDFFKFLTENGISYSAKKQNPNNLKPSQADINAKASKNMKDESAAQPILVSKDGYVIDGHHRWYNRKLKNISSIQTVQIGMNAKELLEKMKDFEKVGMIDIQGKRKSTDQVFKRDGKYIESRKAIHEKILGSTIDHVKPIPPPPGQKPIAIFTAGGPGSGKSNMVKAALEQFGSEMAQIAADEYKKELPEYSEELARGNEDAAIIVHEKSTDIAAEAIERCIASGKPFLLDSTFKNIPKFQKLLKRLQDAGFETHAFYAHCTEEEAVIRAHHRQMIEGRKVDEKDVRHGNKQAREAIHVLGQLVDSVNIFDTMAKGAPPPVLAYRGTRGNVDEESMKKIVSKSAKEINSESDLLNRFMKHILSNKYEVTEDDDQSEIPFGQRLEYMSDEEFNKGKDSDKKDSDKKDSDKKDSDKKDSEDGHLTFDTK